MSASSATGPIRTSARAARRGADGLRFDTEDGSRADLDGYFAIVPGHPEKSDLIARITTDDPDDLMPPPKSGKKLSPREIELLTQWIKAGAKYTKHWAYEKPVRPQCRKSVVRNPESGIPSMHSSSRGWRGRSSRRSRRRIATR